MLLATVTIRKLQVSSAWLHGWILLILGLLLDTGLKFKFYIKAVEDMCLGNSLIDLV